LSSSKKLIQIPADVVAKLYEAANLNNVSFQDYVEEALQQAVRASEMGLTVKEIIDFYELTTIQRTAGMRLIPREVFDHIISEICKKDLEAWRLKWVEAGRWYGKFLEAKLRDEKPLSFFLKVMRTGQWEMDDFSIEISGPDVIVKGVSFTLNEESTELLISFITGFMEALDYGLREKECMRGIINLKFSKNI